MATALIQINAATAGESVLGLPDNVAVTLTDAGGPGATSYQWEFLQGPAPVNPLPTIVNDTAQVATVNPPGGTFTDGLYVVRLTRDDPVDGVSIDTRFFGVPDEDGNHLPTAGVNRNMANVGGSTAAQEAGWFGSDLAGTNTLLDAYLRLRKEREERTFLVGTAGAEPYAPTISANNHQVVKATGATKTVNLPAATNNAKFTILDGIGDAGTTQIDINPDGAETISGQASAALTFDYESLTLIGESGVGWWVI
jgi:hypothetical protein